MISLLMVGLLLLLFLFTGLKIASKLGTSWLTFGIFSILTIFSFVATAISLNAYHNGEYLALSFLTSPLLLGLTVGSFRKVIRRS